MNKYIALIAAVSLCLGSCTNELPQTEAEGTAEIRLSLQAESGVSVTASRETSSLSIADLWVSFLQDGELLQDRQQYGEQGVSVTVKAGDGFSVSAENCTEAKAEQLNDSWGCLRVYGETDAFSLSAGEQKTVSLTCKVVNASVSVSFDAAVTTAFPTYSLTLQAASDASRTLTADASTAGRTAYFNVSDTRTLAYTLRLENKSGEVKTLSQTLTLQPAHAYALRIRQQEATDSQVTVSISVDGELKEEITENWDVNPY